MVHVVPFSQVGWLLQLSVPLHAMAHVSASHVTLPLHARVPEQSTSQPADAGQVMSLWQESVPLHTTAHGTPGGQLTSSLLHEPAVAHVMTHTPDALHVPMPAASHAAMHAARPGLPASIGGGAEESTAGPPESMPGEPESTPIDASAGPPPLSWAPESPPPVPASCAVEPPSPVAPEPPGSSSSLGAAPPHATSTAASSAPPRTKCPRATTAAA